MERIKYQIPLESNVVNSFFDVMKTNTVDVQFFFKENCDTAHVLGLIDVENIDEIKSKEIKINCRGTKVAVNYDLLLRYSKYFQSLVTMGNNIETQIFDASPEIFEKILAYINDKEYNGTQIL